MRKQASLLFFILLACLSDSHGQNGLPFMSDVELNRQFSDSRISNIVQDDEESMYFSTSRGLLKYDGSRWDRIRTVSPALTAYFHRVSGRMFVGMQHGAAEVIVSDSGTYVIQQIPGIETNQPINQILSIDGDIYFIGESEIFVKNSLTTAKAEQAEFEQMLISGAFVNNKSLYLLFFRDGLFRWDKDNLKAVGKYSSIADEQMVFSFESANGTYVGFESDRVFKYQDNKVLPIASHLQKFLSENLLSDGLLLNDSLMALSTLAGGAVVANIYSNDIEYRFDYSTGAKDNEIFCLGTDGDNGLWLAYEGGLTRVDLLQPVRSFSGYPGLDGSVTATLMANGQLYVGTGNGVFLLKKATSQAEMKRMMDEMIRKKEASKKDEISSYTPPPQIKEQEKDSESSDLLERYKENPGEIKQELSKKEIRELKRELRKQRRAARKGKTAGEVLEDWFSGEKNEDEDEEAEDEEVENNQQSGPDPMKNLVPDPQTGPSGSGMTAPPGSGGTAKSKPNVLTKEKALQEVEEQQQKLKTLRNSYLFKRVSGLDVKCRQLVKLKNQVFAATNNGLYLIKGETATNLTPGLYINQVSLNASGNKLLLATIDGVHELSLKNGSWSASILNDTVQFVAYNVVEDSKNNVWAGTDNGAYRYFLDEVKFYPIPEVVNERVIVTSAYGNVHFLLPSSVYHYVAESDTILPAKLPEVPSSDRLEYIFGNDGQLWMKSSYSWHVLNGEEYQQMLPYLDLFEDIRHISTDDDRNIFVVDGANNVFSLKYRSSSSEYAFNVYIRKVANVDGRTFSMDEMTIETDGSSLIFSVSAPFYLKNKGTEYQYRIEGLRNSWSRWSVNSEIDPGNIPPGDYVLQVRARNILGEVSQVKSLAFSVPQPLYLRWYFILIYVMVLVLAVWGIIKYRERSLRETQRILEQEVEKRTADLARAKERTEELLLNILPKETAEELQMSGKATARHYNQVSVLFTDFKGFTQFAESTKPQDLVDELHRYFVQFDMIIGKYFLEKIKTIGDAYMCAGGVPIRNSSNAIAITLAALEIRDFMEEVAVEKKAKGEQALEIRIGIHTGPLTAGVVGMKKFAYDIWGDTVNTASRMESSSEPGKINVSGTTHEMIKKYFDTEYRGQKEAKGKGLIEMYFVKAIKPEFSENGEGKVPNKGLKELIG